MPSWPRAPWCPASSVSSAQPCSRWPSVRPPWPRTSSSPRTRSRTSSTCCWPAACSTWCWSHSSSRRRRSRTRAPTTPRG
ncbi:hypothetical protein ACFFX0_17055 [Citricoccus parietis]|uniref:Uncharacterized protein n=1 Tax=Citricoccus parietis TaxID=592307 RepID=A0ABV5G1K9_9MICC